jgi:hypothetical protein
LEGVHTRAQNAPADHPWTSQIPAGPQVQIWPPNLEANTIAGGDATAASEARNACPSGMVN